MEQFSNCGIPDLLNHYYNSKLAAFFCSDKIPFKVYSNALVTSSNAFRYGYSYTGDEIKAIAELTVKIEVKTLSSKRPHHDCDEFSNQKNKEKCLCVMCRESPVLNRSGSGVINLFQYQDGCCYNFCEQKYNSFGSMDKTCPCEKCRSAEKPSRLWWNLCVTTDQTLVYDEEEASQASCILFYDSKDSPVVVLTRLAISYVSSLKDRVELECITCDVALGTRLFELEQRRHDLAVKSSSGYKTRGLHPIDFFIVTYPNGGPKTIQLGGWFS